MSSRIGYAYNVPDLCRHSVGHRFSHTQTQGGAVIPVIRASGVLIQGEPPLMVYLSQPGAGVCTLLYREGGIYVLSAWLITPASTVLQGVRENKKIPILQLRVNVYYIFIIITGIAV